MHNCNKSGPLVFVNHDGDDSFIERLEGITGCECFRIRRFGEDVMGDGNDLNDEIKLFLMDDVVNVGKCPKNILDYIGRKNMLEKYDIKPLACIHISFGYKKSDFGQWFKDMNEEFLKNYPKSMNINIIDNINFEGEYLGFDVSGNLDGFVKVIFQEKLWKEIRFDELFFSEKSSISILETFKHGLNILGNNDDTNNVDKSVIKAMKLIYLKKWEQSSEIWIGLLMKKQYSRQIFIGAIYANLMGMVNNNLDILHKVTIIVDVWIKYELQSNFVSDDSFKEIIQIISQIISKLLSTKLDMFLIEICTSIWMRSVIWISENYYFDDLSIAYINLIASYLFYLSGMKRLSICRIILVHRYSYNSNIFDYVPEIYDNIQPLSSRIVISNLIPTYSHELLKQSVEKSHEYQNFGKLGNLMMDNCFSPDWSKLTFGHKEIIKKSFDDYRISEILINETIRLIGRHKEEAKLVKIWLHNSDNILIEHEFVRIANIVLTYPSSELLISYSLIPKIVVMSSISSKEYYCNVKKYSYNHIDSKFDYIEFNAPLYSKNHPLRLLFVQFELDGRKLNISCCNTEYNFWFKSSSNNSHVIKKVFLKRNDHIVPSIITFYNDEVIVDSLYLNIFLKNDNNNLVISSIGFDRSNFQSNVSFEKDILQCVQDKGDIISLSSKICISKSQTNISLAPFTIKCNGNLDHGKLYMYISSLDSLVSSSNLLIYPYIISESFDIVIIQKFQPYNDNILFKITNVSNEEFCNIKMQSKSNVFPETIDKLSQKESRILLYDVINHSDQDYVINFVASNEKGEEHCFSVTLI